MPFALIIEKDAKGQAKVIRSTVFPPPPEVVEGAKRLDRLVSAKVPAMEADLNKVQSTGRRVRDTWYKLGSDLRALCEELKVPGIRERRWLWEAIETQYASDRIKRASRGPTRSHLEYCYRFAGFPREQAEKMEWSEWSTWFDSLTVREEPRADMWLLGKLRAGERPQRAFFRGFVRNLNERIRRLETPVLSEEELFRLYDSVWLKTRSETGS